jgi:PAS domain S-box-containing protein
MQVDSLQLMEIQRDLAVELLFARDLRGCLDLLLAAALRLTGFDCGGIYMCDEDTGGLHLIAHQGLSSVFVEQATDYPGDSEKARMVAAGKLIYGLRSEVLPHVAEVLAAEGLEAIIVAPLRNRGKVIACLNVSSHRNPCIDPASRVALESLVALGEIAISSVCSREARYRAEQQLRQADLSAANEMLEHRVARRTANLEAVQAALRAKTKRLELALSGSQAGTWDFTVGQDELRWDRRSREIFGYPQDETLVLGHLFARLHPEDLEVLQVRLSEAAIPECAGDDWNAEFRIVHPELGVRWVQGLGRIERDEEGRAVRMYGIHMDITERKEVENSLRGWNETLERRVAERTRKLRLSEARYQQLADATFEGIAISEDGILIDGNPQIATIHGYELAEMLGRPVIDFVAPESRALVAGHIRRGDESAYECIGLRRDGTTFPAEARANMTLLEERKIRVTALRDLTNIKEAAAKMQEQRAELEHSRQLALVSEISAGIIHQIGQPLSNMGANLAVAMATLEACQPQSRELLEMIRAVEDDVGRMREIVTHLRGLGDGSGLARVPTNLNDVVAGVLPVLSPVCEVRRIELDVDLDPGMPVVMADPVQLSQVMLNLVRNAFDACADCVPDRRLVRIMTRMDGEDRMEMSVRDTGSGIAPEAKAAMFSPYFTTKPDGLGVGLRISRTIAQAHGGTIHGTNNADGPGATFRLVLPVK